MSQHSHSQDNRALHDLTTMKVIGRPLPCFRVSNAPDKSRTAANTAIPSALPHHASLSGCRIEPASVLLRESCALGEDSIAFLWPLHYLAMLVAREMAQVSLERQALCQL